MNRRHFLVGVASGLAAARVAWSAETQPYRVLVTADAESHVAVVDPASGRILRRIRTRELPRSIETVGQGRALVAHSELGVLSLIDADRGRVSPVTTSRGGEPRYSAVHPDGRHVFVTDSKRGDIAIIDVDRAREVGRIEVDGAARHIGIDPSGGHLWTALGSKAREVAIVTLRKGPTGTARVARFRPPFLAHDVAFTPDGRRVWVTSGDRRRIAIFTRGGRLERVIGADASPQHVAFGRAVVYVASGDDGTMRVHRFDGTRLREATIPVGSFNVSRVGPYVVSPSLERGTLTLLDRNGVRRRVVDIGIAAHDACIVSV